MKEYYFNELSKREQRIGLLNAYRKGLITHEEISDKLTELNYDVEQQLTWDIHAILENEK